VFLRTADEVRRSPSTSRLQPSSSSARRASSRCHCSRTHLGAGEEGGLALATEEDPLAIHKRELYWLPSGAQLESELDLNTIEATLGTLTRRNEGGRWKQVAAKYFAD